MREEDLRERVFAVDWDSLWLVHKKDVAVLEYHLDFAGRVFFRRAQFCTLWRRFAFFLRVRRGCLFALKQERRNRKDVAFARDLFGARLAAVQFYEAFSERGVRLSLRSVLKKPFCHAVKSAARVVFSKREFFPFHDCILH